MTYEIRLSLVLLAYKHKHEVVLAYLAAHHAHQPYEPFAHKMDADIALLLVGNFYVTEKLGDGVILEHFVLDVITLVRLPGRKAVQPDVHGIIVVHHMLAVED